MEEVERLATSIDPLLACCMCRCLLREAVQLKCLHNCCQQCFSTAVSKVGSQGVGCGSCGAVTQAGSELSNGFINCQVQRYTMIAESRMCGKCRENGELEKPALVWCPTCRHSLCGDCIAAHRQYNRQHVTQSLEELKSLDEVCSQPPAAACAIHRKPLEIACRNCEQAKCISCWASCKGKKHEVHIVGDESFDSYVANLVACISSIESELLQKSEVLDKPQKVLRNTKAARDRHLEDLNQRKRRVVDAVEMAYHQMVLSTKDAYDDLEAQGDAVVAAAECIASDLSNARNYVRRLVESNEKCEIIRQQKIVRERLSLLSAELDTLSNRLAMTMSEVIVEASLPEDLENVVQAWIGVPLVHSASSSPPRQQQQQQCCSFGAASANLQLPVNCEDVALTKDGRSVLLAAWREGLIEYSSASGCQLSRWPLPKHSSSSGDQDDAAQAVAALKDGRVAVSLRYAQLVVLLRRNEKGSSSTGGAAVAGDAWTEDRRLDQLPWPPRWLSAQGDVLAASESRLDEHQKNAWLSGRRLQLLSLSSGRRLSADLHREYRIRSLAIADRTVVTGSLGKVELGGGPRAACVLDAHSLTDSDGRLWRRVLSSSDEEEELLCGVCADSSGGCLYAAVCRSDGSSGHVSALSLADGSELRHVALSFDPAAAHQQLLPRQLSLSDDEAVGEQQQSSSRNRVLLLAALCWDPTTDRCRTVTLHRGTDDH